jgi:hypothetical protein
MTRRRAALRTVTLFALPTLIGSATLLISCARLPHTTPPIRADGSAPRWNSSSDPVVIAHLTDLHISPQRQDTAVPRARQALDFIARRIRPEFAVLTGDLADNLEGPSVRTPARPIASHWRLYAEIVRRSALPASAIVEVLGNHDTWGALAFRAFAAGALLRPPGDGWFARTIESRALRIVTFVPIRYPAGRLIYNYIVPIEAPMLDALEAELERETQAPFTIVASHFPTRLMFPVAGVRSSRTKRNLFELLGDPKYRVVAYLNGHTHPEADFETNHHPGIVEITAGALLERDGIQILTVDNGRLGYVRVLPNTVKLAVVTSPVSDRLASRVFCDEDFEIRVVSFSVNATIFTVIGSVEGSLVWQRNLSSGGTLWAMNVSVPKGRHSIRFVGDLNQQMNFTVGVPIPPFQEWITVDLWGTPFFVAAQIWSAINILAFLSFLRLPGWLERSVDLLFRYINGEKVGRSVFEYFAWIFWPGFVGYAIRKLPAFPRRYVAFLLLTGFIFPYGTTLIDDRLCLQTTFGYFVASKWLYDVASQIIGFFFLNGIVAGSAAALCLFSFRAPKFTIFHLLASFLLFFVAIARWEYIGRDAIVNRTIWRISLGFHVLPAITLCTYMALRRLPKSKRE